MEIVVPAPVLNLSAAVVDALRRQHKTITFAESCTAGLLSGSFCSVPGASSVFNGGLVSYANSVKNRFLGVPDEILSSVGAVSAECASAMASGARALFDADIALSVTGVAGPGGGTPQKPVGTVFFGCSCGPFTLTSLRRFNGDRAAVRAQSVEFALRIAAVMLNALPPTP